MPNRVSKMVNSASIFNDNTLKIMQKALFSLSLMVLLACGSKNQATTDGTTAVANAITTEVSAPDVSACLLTYQTKMDQLLPLETIQKHYTGDMGKAEKKYDFSPEAKKHDKDTYEYTWPSNRKTTMKLMGQTMEMDVSNRIGLKWLGSDLFMITGKATPLESFKAFYRNASAAEKEAAFKKAGEKMKEKGYDAKTVDAATGVGKDLFTDEITFKEITGVGQAASWRIKEKELTVLVGKITFQVSVEISENDDENIELAKKLALEVLTKCK